MIGGFFMEEIIGKYFICNGNKLDIYQFSESNIKNSSPSIYEVIRVIDGVPLFLEQHMERLHKSASRLNYSIENITDEIKVNILNLISINNEPDKNLKLIVYHLESKKAEYKIYFIKSSYPTIDQYQNGVHSVLYYAERAHPTIKLINTKFKSEVAHLLEHSNAYEALLVNQDNYITEGSRSNLFFIKSNTIYTSPAKNVLPGVTRTNIINLCNDLDISITEQPISINELIYFDALFMTGTSPRILPISSIDDMRFASSKNPILKLLIDEFDKYINKYIEAKK